MKHLTEIKERRGKIEALEREMLKQPQIEIPIEHHFAPGLYLREMRPPAGALITGHIHKTEHKCILAAGSAWLVSVNGEKRLVRAPAVIHSTPGEKRALYFPEASVWINVHHNPTDERDLDKIEKLYVVRTFDELAGPERPVELEEVT